MNRQDQGTIINFNKADDMASVFIYDEGWQRHMEHRLHVPVYKDYGRGGKEYLVPKKSISKPRAPKQLTAEARQKMGERLKAARAKRANK